MKRIGMKRSNVRFDKNVHSHVMNFFETEGFDNYISTVKFLIRLATLSSHKWTLSELPQLTYKERNERTIAFHPRMIQSIDIFPLESSKPLSRNDKINYLCMVGLQEYAAAVKRKEGEGRC